MKKVVPYMLVAILSIIITFFLFEALSFYHFGDIPTTAVLVRLILFCVALFFLLSAIVYFFKRIRK